MADFPPVGGFAGTGGGTGLFVPDTSPFANIAARNTWATNNPEQLITNSTVVNVTGDGWYLWNGNTWIDADPIVQGEPGSAANLADVNVGHVPMKRLDGSFGDSGVEILDNGTVLIPSNTLGIGDLIELSEGTGFGLIHNNESNLNYILLDALLSDVTGSARPRQFAVEPTSVVEFETGGTDTLTDNPLTFDRVISNDGSTFTLNFTATQAMSNTKIRLVDTASGIVIKYIPSKLAWESINLPGYDFRLGVNTINFFSGADDDPANGEFNLGFSPLIFLGGRELTVEIKADNVSLLGNSAINTPNFSGLFGAGEFRDIAYLQEVDELADRVTALGNSASPSGRSFIPFNDGFTITTANLPTYEDVNAIYTAKNDKGEGSTSRPDINLPSDSDIAGAGLSYPVVFEFTHLGGSIVSATTNIIRFFDNGNQIGILQRNQVGVLVKPSAGEDYQLNVSSFQQGTTLLPAGIFELRTDLSIANIDNIATELVNAVVNAGDAFIVDGGGVRFNAVIEPNDVIVALKNSPDLAANSEDWLVIENGRSGNGVTNEQALFFNQIARSGVRFDLGDTVFVSPTNVIQQTNLANNVPYVGGFITPNTNNVEVRQLPAANITFSKLVGGLLTLEYSITTIASGGFLPEFREIILNFDDKATFTFSVLDRGLEALDSVTIQIPNDDYTNILGVVPTVSVSFIERGFQWAGTLRIFSLTNRLTGTLHDPISELIANSIDTLNRSLSGEIASVNSRVDLVNQNLRSINAILTNPVLNLPPPVTSYLANDIVITQQDSLTLNTTPYNLELGINGEPGLIMDEPSIAPNEGESNSDIISIAAANRRGRKVFYLNMSGFSDGDTIVKSTTDIPMITLDKNNIVCRRFVPAIPSGSYSQTNRPTPANTFERDWYTVELHTSSLQAEADELFFVNNLPTSATPLTVLIRYAANGQTGATQTITVPNVGGTSDVSQNYSLSLPDGETVAVTLQWRASAVQFVVQGTPQANNRNFFIFDMQVSLSWVETVTTPGSAETFENVVIAEYIEGQRIPIAMKPDGVRTDNDNRDIVFVTPTAEVNTGYSFTLRFGGTDNQYLVVNQEGVMFFNAIFDANSTTLTSLQAHMSNPYFGLFSQDHSVNDVLEFDTKLKVPTLILTSPDGTDFEITITNEGEIDIK